MVRQESFPVRYRLVGAPSLSEECRSVPKINSGSFTLGMDAAPQLNTQCYIFLSVALRIILCRVHTVENVEI